MAAPAHGWTRPDPATAVKAMLLAAGRGERLRPLTDTTPKPLIEVGGRTLIERHLDALKRAGVSEVLINLSHLGERIRAHLGDGRAHGVAIHYSDEGTPALETAGGVRRALEWFGDASFLLIASDTLSDIDLLNLRTRPSGRDLAHLVLVDNPPHHPTGDFGCVRGRATLGGFERYTYSGVGVYAPALFRDLPDGRYPLRPMLDDAIRRGLISAEVHRGLWLDVGTPERLAEAQRLV
jgi:N-acetyl-alpha-D-muramate 1-phosphate uridylyltransferase